MSSNHILVVILLVGHHHLLVAADAPSISCKGPDGSDVDWIYAYKLPRKFPPQHGDAARAGLEFVYLTSADDLSNATATEWRLSERTIADPLSCIGRTVVQAYDGNDDASDRLAVLAWNDQPPAPAPDDEQRGHTKGVLVADAVSAAWIVHSVPHYPAIESKDRT